MYEQPKLAEVRAYHQQQKASFWEEYLRLEVPEVYPVALSDELRELKQSLIFSRQREVIERKGGAR